MDSMENTMADFTRQIQSKLQGLIPRFRKSTRHWMASGNHNKAARYLEKGRKYYNKKKYSTAERFFKRALRVDPLYPLAHYMMGLVFYKRNDTRGAKRHWEQAIKTDPTSDVAAKADKKIESINAKTKQVIQALEDRQKY